MRLLILALSIMVLASCATSRQEEPLPFTLDHALTTPREYQFGRSQAAFAGSSDAARYVEAHERGWWYMLSRYAKDIDYELKLGDLTSSGNAAAVNGFLAGAEAAHERAEGLIKRYGEMKTHNLIRDAFGRDIESY